MKTSTKIKTFIIIFFVAIAVIITARHFVGLHFKKKFSVRPAPGVIVKEVQKSQFYKSIETFGTAIAQNSKTYRIKKDDVIGNLRITNRFVKKGEIIAALKNSNNVVADFAGKLGKREIAQGVLGSDSLIITLDDLKKIVIDIKIPESYVGILRPGLKAEITSSAFNEKIFKGRVSIRFILFCMVGLSGIFVQLLITGLAMLLINQFPTSQTLGIIAAMTSNYFLNNIITFQERKLKSLDLIRGLFSFYLICSLGAFANIAVATYIFGFSSNWLISSFVGACFGAVWNFTLTSIFTWKSR